MWEFLLIELSTLFLAFHLYSFDIQSDYLKYLLWIIIYLYGFRSGMGLHICEWPGFRLTSLRPC
jgi:hypothetical protein